MREKLLEVSALEGWYGQSHVLHKVNFHVHAGEIVTLLGRNGAGKTSILRALMGIQLRRSGMVRLRGRDLIGSQTREIARAGMAYCPEERAIFSSLNVEENLLLPPVFRPGGFSVAEIYELFPRLQERRNSQGTKLSGGEQQMLAIARILRTGANLLLLDEPTEGLAPVIVQQIGRLLLQLKERGMTILLVEQNFHFASRAADRHYIVEHGRVVDNVDRAALAANKEMLHKYLGV